MSSPFTILYDELDLVFDKCVLKSTMRVCKGWICTAWQTWLMYCHEWHAWWWSFITLVDLFFLSCFNIHMRVWDPYWLELIFYNYMLINVSLQRLLLLKTCCFVKLHPRSFTLGASIVRKSACYYKSNSMQIQVVSLLYHHYTIRGPIATLHEESITWNWL